MSLGVVGWVGAMICSEDGNGDHPTGRVVLGVDIGWPL